MSVVDSVDSALSEMLATAVRTAGSISIDGSKEEVRGRARQLFLMFSRLTERLAFGIVRQAEQAGTSNGGLAPVGSTIRNKPHVACGKTVSFHQHSRGFRDDLGVVGLSAGNGCKRWLFTNPSR